MRLADVRQFLVDYGQFRRLRFSVVESIDLAMTRVRVRRADAALSQAESRVAGRRVAAGK
jgi:hypothetical protein